MNYRAILFDFDGVLCNGQYYDKYYLSNYPGVHEWIQENIFGNNELVQKWMRNQISSIEINKIISENTGNEFNCLNEIFQESIRKMSIEIEINELAESLKLTGRKIGIVTDNMDVFTQITVPNHKLNSLFDVIINSASYGILKRENCGKLYDIALAALSTDIKNSLLIDDSELTINMYKEKGGYGFLYKNFAELKSFLQL
ncbi:MAG: hypothetical protein EHM58_01705 [Ignavibacteriae bacterium]|nr:MAG: hypothetical protein EHM58_01705 [Ignavibacteriota bacterium]